VTANVKCTLNKGDFNDVAGLQPADIFMGVKMIVICCCTISRMGGQMIVSCCCTWQLCFLNCREKAIARLSSLVDGLSCCLSFGTDSLYMRFQPTIWALNYPRKHTNCAISLKERHLPTPLRHIENTGSIETELRCLCGLRHFHRQILILISNVN